MKSFFKMFSDSFKNFKNLRALTTASMLLAMAIAIRTLSIDITTDLRLGFTFIPIAAIGMLYGPVICGISSFLLDFLGYIITNKSARFYSPQLALVVLLSGVIYGMLLYRCDFQKAMVKSCIKIVAACIAVGVICNIMLNTYFLYTLYVNKDFSMFNSDDLKGFWTYMSPRAIKNLIEIPIHSVVLILILPVVKLAHQKVSAQFSKRRVKT